MKKILLILSVLISTVGYSQVKGISGNKTYIHHLSANDYSGDSMLIKQFDKELTLIHRQDVYGLKSKGIFNYGSQAGLSITGATEGFIGLGFSAGRLNSAGYSVFLGDRAGTQATGYGNVFIGGYNAGTAQTTGDRNLVIGYDIGAPSYTGSNQMNIMAAIFGAGVGEVNAQNISEGNVGMFVKVPTARLHLPAPQSGAGLGSLKFNTGTLPTTPELGLMNMKDGLWFIDSSTSVRDTIATREWARANISGGGSSDPPSYINVVTGPTDFYQLARQRNDSILDIKALKLTYGGTAITPTVTDTTTHYALDSAVRAGTYIPTITGTANLAASTDGVFEWTESGGWYDVTGEISLDPTTTATLTVVRISLPISSSIPFTRSLIGFASDDLGTVGRIRGDTGNNEAQVRFTPIDVTNRVFSVRFRFKYVAP